MRTHARTWQTKRQQRHNTQNRENMTREMTKKKNKIKRKGQVSKSFEAESVSGWYSGFVWQFLI